MAASTFNLNSVTTSTGHRMSSAEWVDAHFKACAREYEAMIRSVGLQRGWHVLDAGCGTGGFLPTICELVGERGRITAIDVAPEHVAAVRAKAEASLFECAVTPRLGDVKELPFEDATFDAIWSANVVQYLDKDELRATLTEFRRVLKPGGLLAIKDGDITALQIFPIPPTILWRLLTSWAERGDRQIRGLLESLKLDQHLREAGLAYVTREIAFIERSAPLCIAESQFVVGLVEFFAELAPTLDLPATDLDFWRSTSDAESGQYILKQPGLYLREEAILTKGYEALM